MATSCINPAIQKINELKASASKPITAKHLFGWARETELKSTLETHLGEELYKTAERYDSIDFHSANWAVELKCRQRIGKNGALQLPATFKSWLLPEKKVAAARASKGLGRCYYYWDADHSLWYIDYAAIDWESLVCGVPTWHTEEHFFIPAELWRRVL